MNRRTQHVPSVIYDSVQQRRNFLRIVGGGLFALPCFESLVRAEAVNSEPPMYFAFIYTPNGYNQASFVPSGKQFDEELPAALQPLSEIRNRVSLLSGLDRQFVPGTGVHAQCGSCWLTSSAPQETLDGGFPTNVTLDQMLAKKLGSETALPSLELSCNDFTNNKETKYFESISWYGPGHAARTEKNPRAVFRRLFGTAEGDESTRSVLDVVHQSANELSKRLSTADRLKLEEYLESVRKTERRIQMAEKAKREMRQPPFPEPAGIPEDRGSYIRLMCDLVVHAFELDLTRVATLVIDPERWDSPRHFHGVFDTPQNHHVLTHTKGEEAKAKLTEIDRFHVSQYAYLVQRLAALPSRDGATSLLDRSWVAMGSGISDGDRHNYADLQVLLAGGQVNHVGYQHYEGRRPLANLWLTCARRAGIAMDRFADSDGVLNEI